MNPKMNESQLRQKLQDALDERAANLDGATLSRLRQARTQALEQPRRWWQGVHWQAAGLATALASVTLVAVLVMRQPTPEALPFDAAEDAFEVATLEHELELIEDMAFYSWLETQNIDEQGQSTYRATREASLAG